MAMLRKPEDTRHEEARRWSSRVTTPLFRPEPWMRLSRVRIRSAFFVRCFVLLPRNKANAAASQVRARRCFGAEEARTSVTFR